MSRKVIYSLAASLDGFIATKDGSVDWLQMSDLEEGAEEMREFFASIDTILFGRKTYEKGLEMGGGPTYAGIYNYVFTRSEKFESDGDIEFIKDDPERFVQDLKKKEGKDILLMGGGDLASTFLVAGLIDEIIVGIQPVVLGAGIPLFDGTIATCELERFDLKTRKSGTVQVSYRILNAVG